MEGDWFKDVWSWRTKYGVFYQIRYYHRESVPADQRTVCCFGKSERLPIASELLDGPPIKYEEGKIIIDLMKYSSLLVRRDWGY